MLETGLKVGISDISGAFDRVDRDFLTCRLREAGVSDELTELLYDYLAPRMAEVLVQGYRSSAYEIADEVFQATPVEHLL